MDNANQLHGSEFVCFSFSCISLLLRCVNDEGTCTSTILYVAQSSSTKKSSDQYLIVLNHR